MRFTVDVADAQKFSRGLATFGKAFRKPVDDALRTTAKEIAGDARRSIRGRGPSSPGQPPARRSGELAKSIRFKKWRRGGVGYSVFAIGGRFTQNNPKGRPYNRFLELSHERVRELKKSPGARGVLRKRPYLMPAAERHAAEFDRRMTAAIEEVLRAVAKA